MSDLEKSVNSNLWGCCGVLRGSLWSREHHQRQLGGELRWQGASSPPGQRERGRWWGIPTVSSLPFPASSTPRNEATRPMRKTVRIVQYFLRSVDQLCACQLGGARGGGGVTTEVKGCTNAWQRTIPLSLLPLPHIICQFKQTIYDTLADAPRCLGAGGSAKTRPTLIQE